MIFHHPGILRYGQRSQEWAHRLAGGMRHDELRMRSETSEKVCQDEKKHNWAWVGRGRSHVQLWLSFSPTF